MTCPHRIDGKLCSRCLEQTVHDTLLIVDQQIKLLQALVQDLKRSLPGRSN